MTETRTTRFNLPQWSDGDTDAPSRTDFNGAFAEIENRSAYDDGATASSLPVTNLFAGRYARQSVTDGYALYRRSASAWEWVAGTVMPVRRYYRGAAGTDVVWSTDIGGSPLATMTAAGDFATPASVRSLFASAGADLDTTPNATTTGRSYVRTRADDERGLVLAAHGAGAGALLTVREAGSSDVLTVDALGRLRSSVPAAFGQAAPIAGVPLSAAALTGVAGAGARLHGSTSAPVTAALQVYRSLSDLVPIAEALPDHLTFGRTVWSGGQISLLAPELDSTGEWTHTGDFDASGAVTSFGGRALTSVSDLALVIDPVVDQLVHLTTDNMIYRRLASSWLGVLHLSTEGHARYLNTAEQTIPTSTGRKVYLPAAVSTTADVTATVGDTDTGSYFTLNRGGRWAIEGSAAWAFAAGSTYREAFIGDDTATARWAGNADYNQDAGMTNSAGTTRRFDAGQRVALWVFHARGSNLNLVEDTDNEAVSLALTWLGP